MYGTFFVLRVILPQYRKNENPEECILNQKSNTLTSLELIFKQEFGFKMPSLIMGICGQSALQLLKTS